MCLTLGWLHISSFLTKFPRFMAVCVHRAVVVCCVYILVSNSTPKICNTPLGNVTNIYLKALNSNCLSHKNNVGMYLTQCERTAIPFEMINKFYYYLSSLKVAASTL